MTFKPVDNNPNFPLLEHDVLRFWRENRIFDRLREQNAGGPRYSFFDGPITANNPMGVHHAWGRTYKDLYQRYKAMQGYQLRYQNGFDCQGLWLEVEVEKALGFNSKRDIEAFGLDKFAEQCRARVLKFSEKQTQQSIRLGQWMDWENSYYTMSDTNIEYIWHFLKVVNERGWLAEKALIMPWCIRCGTSLAQHELTDSYRTVTHRSVYVKLPLNEHPGEYLLAWTTTPWTLSSNMALAVNPSLDYAQVQQGEEVYYLSTGTLKLLKGDFVQIGTLKGSALIARASGGYAGPFDDLALQQGVVHPVLPWAEVSDEEGTGIVHIAPGCGAEDYNLYTGIFGKQARIIAPIDDSGLYLAGFGQYSGRHVREVTNDIFSDLTAKNRIYKIEDYTHRYPVCWRCGEDLVYRLVDEWFILADGPAGNSDPEQSVRVQMKRNAEQVRWLPEASGKRMQNWLDNMGDWCISRKRYWGLPLPFYRCANKHVTTVGSRAELRQLATNPAAVDNLKELHRPWIDEVTITCPQCQQEAKRVTEVGDCWLDAGIVPFSTLKYLEDKDYWQQWFPAEFITEMREQVRLWFYSQLFMSTTLVGKAPYQTVLTNEMVRDEKGERISKTKGNGVPYDEAVEKMGADVLRWLYAGQNNAADIKFGYGPAREVTRHLLTLWNTYNFFVTYANLDGLTVANLPPNIERSELDRWIRARLHLLIQQTRAALDNYDSMTVTKLVTNFIEDLSNWYVRRSRRRFWKSESDEDKVAAYATLYEALVTLVSLLAPIMPFLSEQIYQNLVVDQLKTAPASVHLIEYPFADESLIDRGLIEEIDLVIKVVSMGRMARQRHELKVRQPLAAITVRVRNQQEAAQLARHSQQIEEELNVKAVKITTDGGELVSYVLKPNLRLLGKKYGKQLPAITAALAAADGAAVAVAIAAGQPVSINLAGESLALQADEVLVETKEREGLAVFQDEGLVVALDTELTPELRAEGLARDLVRVVQDMRKAAGFSIADRIVTYYVGNGAAGAVLTNYREYIASETLSRDLVALASSSELPAAAYQQSSDLNGEQLLLAVQQTGEQASGIVADEE